MQSLPGGLPAQERVILNHRLAEIRIGSDEYRYTLAFMPTETIDARTNDLHDAGPVVVRAKKVILAMPRRSLGVEHVFAVPGDYAGPFLEELDATPGIARVATVNELGSGYAADGYARFRGAGAACV